jgi:outer membrane protein TolC
VALLEDLEAVALARYQAGEAPRAAPLEAEVELAHLAHREVALATEAGIAVRRINALLHRDSELPLPPPPERLEPPPEPPGEADPAALAENPELRASQAQVHARELAVDLARREFLPDFTLVGGFDRFWQERDLQPSVGLQVELPLRLDRRRAALEEARARLEGARREYQRLEDDVRFAVASGAARLREARHLIHLYRERLLPAARDQVEAARAAFETGQLDFSDLIEAERSLRSARLGHEEALAEASRRAAELERATGGVQSRRSGGEQ